MFKKKISLDKNNKRWLVIKNQVNKYLEKMFRDNPLLNSEHYCYWKKNKLFF